MIITKYIQKMITQYNKKTYEKYGNIGETIYIPVNELSKESHQKIDVQCEHCGEIKEIKYQTYNRNTDSGRLPYHCNKKECINTKREMIIKEKYGCKNVFQINCVKDKIKETCIEKYGVENPHQNEEVKTKAEETCLEKYGFRNVFQNEDIKQKSKETRLIKYGFEYSMQSEISKEKSKETSNKNYGTDYPMQNIIVFNKCNISSLKIKKYNNTDIYYQASYEKDFLDRYFDKFKIENGKSIPYEYNGKNKRYLTDFYLPDFDLIVEIKSDYWLRVHKERCKIKSENAKKYHNYIMILNKNYDEFENIIYK